MRPAITVRLMITMMLLSSIVLACASLSELDCLPITHLKGHLYAYIIINDDHYYIIGDIDQPGSYSYAGQLTVSDLLRRSGGFMYVNNAMHIERNHCMLRATEDTLLFPGDVIVISKGPI